MKNIRNHAATGLGLLTSISLAYQSGMDVTTLDYSSVGTYVKLVIYAVPAIGGYFSELKSIGKKDEEVKP